jgi:hypothetical protein
VQLEVPVDGRGGLESIVLGMTMESRAERVFAEWE